ncbi:Com family DNA-binding transcriptional regulator [Limnohabitans sp.]|uniref:Com family DNA-binding transcriptional regulator n=1 Tax=Limnohabitans sp. TaxID=1907725 RepID=UPI00286F2B3B|nr:Com family DNA-binding transcriptional regulator [Limnohabitans sp.]
MQELRCGACSKLLARGVFERVQIKCGRCRTLNDVRAGAEGATSPQPERPRASKPNKGVTQHGENARQSGFKANSEGR